MMIFLVCIGLAAALAIIMINTRSARLKRLADTLRMRYDAHLEEILTEEAKQSALAFQQEIHRFYHVLTSNEPGAFLRICDDRILSEQNPYSSAKNYTLVTAELTRGAFTPLILMPLRPGQTEPPHPALSPVLAAKYMLSAPDTYQLPDTVLGFLQAAQLCYLELTPTALIYHEFDTKSVAEIQPLRFRVKQLLEALVHQPAPLPNSSAAQTLAVPAQTFVTTQPAFNPQNTSPSQGNNADLEALALLKMQSASSYGYSQTDGTTHSMSRWIYLVIILLALGFLCLFATYALRHWVVR